MVRLIAGFVAGVLFVVTLVAFEVLKEMSDTEALPNVEPDHEYFPDFGAAF